MGSENLEQVASRPLKTAEVESSLLKLGLVTEAIVVERGDQIAGQRPVAYVVPTAQPAPTPVELRAALAGHIPDDLLPSAFVLMDALPRKADGAIDTSALPVPYAPRPMLANKFEYPRDPLEQLLAEAWEECLNVRPVGITDHFFELGGDSLLAAQMLRTIEERTGKSLTPEVLLSRATVKDLAEELLRPLDDAPSAQLVEIQDGPPRSGDCSSCMAISTVVGSIASISPGTWARIRRSMRSTRTD